MSLFFFRIIVWVLLTSVASSLPVRIHATSTPDTVPTRSSNQDFIRNIEVDTIITGGSYDNLKFKPNQLILPAALITAGTIGVYFHPFRHIDYTVSNGMNDLRGKENYLKIDDYIQYLPAVCYLTMGWLPNTGKHSFRERAAVELTAYLVMTAIVKTSKHFINEKRPRSSAMNSFPSGHTSNAFTGAELIRLEYGGAYGIGAYAVATGIAFMRLYNNRHWLNDIIGGAGVGILAARIGYWMLPLYRKWFKWDSFNSTNILSVMPSPDFRSRSVSVNMVMLF